MKITDPSNEGGGGGAYRQSANSVAASVTFLSVESASFPRLPPEIETPGWTARARTLRARPDPASHPHPATPKIPRVPKGHGRCSSPAAMGRAALHARNQRAKDRNNARSQFNNHGFTVSDFYYYYFNVQYRPFHSHFHLS